MDLIYYLYLFIFFLISYKILFYYCITFNAEEAEDEDKLVNLILNQSDLYESALYYLSIIFN